MTVPSPLAGQHADAAASFLPWGPADRPIAMVESFGEPGREYAALRRSAGLFDEPWRATIEITGSERIAFLERMLTQKLTDIEPLHWRPSFWLNRKGRIDADIRIIELGDRTLLDLDAHAADHTRTSLEQYLFAEDVALADRSAEFHRLSVHGPRAVELVARLAEPVEGPPLPQLAPRESALIRIAGHRVVADRVDTTGDGGLSLLVPAAGAAEIAEALLAIEDEGEDDRAAIRPVGWAAYNIARLEGGTPMHNIDFGSSNLPAETGVLRDRVHFQKGCYLGQEVVARMDALGHPKQVLVALEFGEAVPRDEQHMPIQPITGSAVLAGETPVGVITSSTLAPMLGSVPIAFAMVKWAHTQPGTELLVEAEGQTISARVRETLRYWSRPS